MLQEGVEWFGGYSSNVSISVTTPPNGSSYISQSVPSSLTPGQTASVSVTMKNTGGTTWSPGAGYKLGSQNSQDNTTWGSARQYLNTNVGPNGSYTFPFNITAPSSPGTYNFQWRMLQEGVEWFGGYSSNVSITVTSPRPTCTSATPDGEWAKYNGTRTTTANGVTNATRVLFPTWSESGGQDDIIWYQDTNGSDGWTATANLSSHPGLGNIFVHVYLYNASYNDVWCDSANFVKVKTGSVNVTIEGAYGWQITGPNGFSQSGTGNINLSNLFYGNYTITPAAKPGHTTYINGAPAASKTIELKD